MPFSESQKKAVMHTDGPMLVLAGPGSGKTTVITERTARLTESGVSPSSVLVVTFTRAAAAEMKGRFLKRTEGRAAGVAVGTFHSVFTDSCERFTVSALEASSRRAGNCSCWGKY